MTEPIEDNIIALNHLTNSFHYLQNFPKTKNVPKLDFHHFDILLQFEYQAKWDKLLSQNAVIVFSLLDEHRQNILLCTELAEIFWIVVSRKWPAIVENFIESNIDKHFVWLYPCMKNLSPENELILYLGMIKYVTHYEYNFSTDNFHCKIDCRMKQEISLLLPNLHSMHIIVRMTDLWLDSLLAKCVARKEEEIKEILSSLFAVIIVYWNHRLANQLRIEPVVRKCLEFDYIVSKEETFKEIILIDRLDCHIISHMTIWKYMMDISWKVPFKYFICRHLLEFAISKKALSEILFLLQEDFPQGFRKNLQNKNIVGVEAELFTFCLNNFSYEEWKCIVDTSICYYIMRNKSMASYFSKWWLPQIVKKFPAYVPELYVVLENLPEDVRPIIETSILKICCNEKIPLAVTENEQSLIQHIIEQFTTPEEIRADVFSLLCDLHEQSALHSEQELDAIRLFLAYNVNSNCTMLRQILLSSFSRCILRMICSSVRVIKRSEMEADEKLNHVLKFLRIFNGFIADGIQPGCSYQRIVTSLNLYKILMTYAVRDCGSSIHRNNLKDADKFVSFAKKRNAWYFESDMNRKLLFNCLMDSCEEIQNLASILLRNYFILKGEFEAGMFEEAMRILQDNQFYKRNGGVAAVISLICMACNPLNGPQTVQIEHSSFSELFLKVLEGKVEIIDKDILDAVKNHPLDGDIKVLNFLLTDQSSPEINRVTEEQVEKLIGQLEKIVPLLLKALFVDKSSDYAPSFEESDLALRLLIKNSVLRDTLRLADEADQCQLQPLNQLLLNSIWITLKVCSELESNLIINRTSFLNEKQIVRCCNLIVSKLKLCRHKGVIEAAGFALSNVVKILTARNLCVGWLESVVVEVLHLIEFKSGATISRKSAGLSLLIQNVVAGDKRPNKPLIAKCWKEFERILDVDYGTLSVDISQELPQTHALHLLRVIVADTRNNAELLPFLEDITILCLNALQSPAWLIRNAALQLFGALLPKIVGQRNATPEIGVRCSFEETFLTMPRILDRIISTLEQATKPGGSVQHADLAPLLTVLMNVRLTSTVIMDQTLYEKLLKLRILIEDLLCSDLYTIRELASKSLLSLYSLNDILLERDRIVNKVVEYVIRGKELRGENHVHGCLLALKQIYFFNNFLFLKSDPVRLFTLKESLNVSLVSQALLFDMNLVKTGPTVDVLNHIDNLLNKILTKCYLSIGYDQWLHAVLKNLLGTRSIYDDVLEECSKCSNSEVILMACLDILCEIKDRDFVEDDEVFVKLLNYLESYLKLKKNDVVIRIIRTFIELYQYHSKYSFDLSGEFVDKYFDTLINLDYHHFQGSNIRMLAILVANSHKSNLAYHMLKVIYETLDISKYNKTIRLNAADAMIHLCEILKERMVYSAEITWKICLDLVQDEEAEIRFIGSRCIANVFHLMDYGPEFTMTMLFNPYIIGKYLDMKNFIDFLWDKIKITSFPSIINSDEIRNPFDQGVVNCYEEEVIIVRLAGTAWEEILQKDLNLCREYFSSVQFNDDFYLKLKNNLNEFFIPAEEYIWYLKCYYSCLIWKKIKDSEDIDSCLQFLKQVLKI